MTYGSTHTEVRRTGHKTCCDLCGKVVFGREERARSAARKITASGTPMKHYRGQCGWWHVSRVRRRR